MKHTLGRRLLSFAFGAAIVVVMAATAAAQNVEPPVAPGEFVESWALSPSGEDPGEASSRPTLTYNIAPGGTVEDSVTLWNYSSVPVAFRLLATDAFNNAAGDFSLLETQETPKGLGSWITVATTAITVPARTSATIPITVQVPADASPGDHAAAVLAATDTVGVDENGNEINLDRRIGPRVYVRVAGPVNPELTVEDLSSKYRGQFDPFDGDLDVTYTVRNPGNVRLGARQVLVVEDLFGRTVERRKLKTIDELLPGNEVTFHETVSGVPATLRVKASIELEPITPQGVSDAVPAAFTATTSALAIPWTVLLVLALVFLLWRLYRRWRRGQDEPPPPAPTPRQRLPEPVGS